METISNIILIVAVLIAILYCRQLSARLHRFSRLENEMGDAIAVLSQEVEQMTSALSKAQRIAAQTNKTQCFDDSCASTVKDEGLTQSEVQRPRVMRRERRVPMRAEA